MPTVAEAIREGQRGIRSLEPEIVRALLGHYDLAWHAVERILLRYEAQIQAAIDAGIEPRPSWLRQQVWYRRMQDSIDREMMRFEADAARTLAYGQQQAVGISGQSARLFTAAVGVEGGIVARVNASAFERWVSALQPGSPVRGVLNGYNARVAESVMTRMSEGLGSGRGISGILRDVRRDVGPDAVRGRVHSFVRTEVHRSLRGADADFYAAMPSGVIQSYEWRSAKDGATCILCLSQDGQRFPTYQMTMHVSCRCRCVPIANPALAPPVGRPRETGREWFARQPEAVKRQIMPTQAHYDLYRSGMSIDQFVGYRRSRTWGTSIALRPASALRGAA